MIYIDFVKSNNGDILGFYMKGHSGFNYVGEDIVCAAVSSAAYMAANTITDVLDMDADVFVSEGRMHLLVDESSADRCRDILLGLMLHLSSLQEQYTENININCSSTEQ